MKHPAHHLMSSTAIAIGLLITIMTYGPSFGATSSPGIVAEWEADEGDEWRPEMSPDGLHVAHFDASNALIYDVETRKDTKVDSLHGFGNHLSFSPDGTHLALELDGISTVRLDGSGILRLVSSNIGDNPVYSPDGKQIMVQVHPAATTNETFYLAALSADTPNQQPDKLIEDPALPFLWSSDSTAIYYGNRSDGLIYRFDLKTRSSRSTGFNSDEIVLRLPGTDILLVQHGKTLSVINLQGVSNSTHVSAELLKTVASLPQHDSKARDLIQIQLSKDSKRLLLVYSCIPGGPTDKPKPWQPNCQHVQLIAIQ
jgi:hypothetical protein